VPARAPRGDEEGNTYAEWSPWQMYEPDTPTAAYHRSGYGDAEYDASIEGFSAEAFDPEGLARLFADVGARYVAITAEHHDGFALWDSDVGTRNAAVEGPERDLVAELGAAVRDRGLRFVPSYHGLLNYYDPRYEEPFGHPDYDPEEDPGPAYVEETHAKLRELFEAHRPDLLWLDGDRMANAERFRTTEIVADYYNRAEQWDTEVAVNDRLGRTRWKDDGPTRGDFATPEYESYDGDRKWEACRGIGRSFGFNRRERDGDYLAPGELVRSFVDVVARGGNLLINVGPRADGTIPGVQERRLRALGAWLDRNGEAVFGSREWRRASDTVAGPAALVDPDDVKVRYTWNDALYATLFAWPGETVVVPVGAALETGSDPEATLLGVGPVPATAVDGGVRVDLPPEPDGDHAGYAYGLRIEGVGGPD